MIHRSVFIRFTSKTGHSYIEERRVWDLDRFLAALDQWAKVDDCSVSITTEDHYRKERRRQ